MKIRKGFTLVELLAVISILALLVIIALPNIMALFNEAKERSFLTECKQIYKTAQSQWMTDSMFDTKERVYNRCNTCMEKQLPLSGRKEIDYYVKLNKAGKVVVFYATDGTYQFEKEEAFQITDFLEAKRVVDLDKPLVVVNKGKYKEPQKVPVCAYQSNITNGKFTYRKNNPIKQCMDNISVGQCLGSLYSGVIWHYSLEFENCIKNATVDYTACGYFHGAENINECYNKYAHRIETSGDMLISEFDGGCFSPNEKGLAINCCLDGESEVEVYDKKKKKKLRKKLKDVTIDDLLLVWDFDKGEYTYVEPLWIMNPVKAYYYYLLKFDNGSTLKVIGDHKLFNKTKNKFVNAGEECGFDIGDEVFTTDNKVVKLVSIERIDEEIDAYNVITNYHMNLFANGILTSCVFSNLYDIEDMKYVRNEKDKITESDLANIDSKYVKGLRLTELRSDFKGTKEETIKYIKDYIDKF